MKGEYYKMTNAELEAIVAEYGGPERVVGLFFDNPGDILINYPQSPKWTNDDTSDVVLKTIGGVDCVVISNVDRTLTGITNQDKAVWYDVIRPTENLQAVACMYPGQKDRPQEVKVWIG